MIPARFKLTVWFLRTSSTTTSSTSSSSCKFYTEYPNYNPTCPSRWFGHCSVPVCKFHVALVRNRFLPDDTELLAQLLFGPRGVLQKTTSFVVWSIQPACCPSLHWKSIRGQSNGQLSIVGLSQSMNLGTWDFCLCAFCCAASQACDSATSFLGRNWLIKSLYQAIAKPR